VKFEKQHLTWVMIGGIGVILLAIGAVLASRVDAARIEFNKAEEMLKLYQSEIMYAENLDQSRLETDLAQANLGFPASENLSVFIAELNDEIDHYGITVKSISPGAQVEVLDQDKDVLSGLDRVSIEMKLNGTYNHLGLFLHQLSRLRSGHVRIRLFDLSGEKEDSDLMLLSITIDVFVRKDPDFDILAQEMGLKAPVKRQAGTSEYDEIERNPFVTTEIELPDFNIEGIIYDSETPMVLIAGEVKKVGDQVGETVIQEIQPDSVIFKSEKEEIRINFPNK
jgi:Tfp pilus assembly protein PilO